MRCPAGAAASTTTIRMPRPPPTGWLPVGLMMPVSVLLPLERGPTLAEAGSVAAVQGIVVMILELPTGGLTDALGRRPVLVAAGVFNLAAFGLLAVARSVPAFAAF